jgi:hypothetical protein
MVNKKIIAIIIVLLLAGTGVYFGVFRMGRVKLKAGIGDLETPEIKMPFESGLETLELNTFDIGATLPASLFSNIAVDTNFGGSGGVQIGIPGVSVSVPNWQGSTGPTVDESTCGQFKTAPSCSFVPQQYRELCQQCKAAGF